MFREVLDQLERHRDKLSAAIDVIRQWADRDEPIAPTAPAPVDVVHATKARAKPRVVKRAKTGPRAIAPPPPRHVVGTAREDETAARRAAVLKYLREHDGMAESRAIAKAMPTEPSLTAEQRIRAYSNTMSTLKALGYVSRSGSVWSITDKGRQAA